jgi:outer membrane protein assembly factor BamB
MRLHFFPALLPLAPMLPWLLTALGALAGAFRFMSRRRGAAAVAVALLALATGTALWQHQRLPSETEGSRLTPAASLPQPQRAAPGDVSLAAKTAASARTGALSELWSRFSTRRVLSAALAPAPSHQDALLIGTYEGELQKISAQTGETAWTLRKSGPILAQAAFLGDTAFVGEGLHTAQSSALTAIEVASGKALWQREFRGHLESPPAIDEPRSRLYVGSGPAGLWAIDAKSGGVLWHAPIGHVDSTPLLKNASLWVTAQVSENVKDSKLHELDPETGASRFALAIPGQPWGALQTSGDLVLFTSGVGQIGAPDPADRGWSHAFSLKSKTLAWSVALESMPLLSSTLSEKLGLVFHTLKTGKVVALRLTDGSVAWSFDLAAPCSAPPTLIGDRDLLAVLASTGNLVLLDARGGKLVQKIEAGSNSTAAALYRDSRVFVSTGDSLTAFELLGEP